MASIQVTCQGADSLPIDVLSEFQGKLKDISRENLDKLKRVISERGFFAPIFVWQAGGDNFIIDGHQRLKALLELRQEGWDIPPLPVAYIGAADEKEAKEKLLFITGAYGQFTDAGFSAFTFDLDLPTLAPDLQLPDFSVALSVAKARLQAGEDLQGSSTRSSGTPIIKTEIIFDTVEQQNRWFGFVRQLRAQYPGMETTAERIDAYLQEAGVE